MLQQKFRQLRMVHVTKDMPFCMSHYQSDFDAIVKGSYSQLHSGRDIYQYCLYVLEDGKVVKELSWYTEDMLTLLPDQDQDPLRAEELIEEYHFGTGK